MQDKQCHTTMQLWSGQNSEKKVLEPSMNYIYFLSNLCTSLLFCTWYLASECSIAAYISCQGEKRKIRRGKLNSMSGRNSEEL